MFLFLFCILILILHEARSSYIEYIYSTSLDAQSSYLMSLDFLFFFSFFYFISVSYHTSFSTMITLTDMQDIHPVDPYNGFYKSSLSKAQENTGLGVVVIDWFSLQVRSFSPRHQVESVLLFPPFNWTRLVSWTSLLDDVNFRCVRHACLLR